MKPSPRPGLRLLLLNLALLTAVVVVFLLSRSYWDNFFSGPVAVNDAFLLAAGADGSGGDLIRYVELTDRVLTDTNWVGEVRRNDKALYSDKFFVTPVGDRLLLVQAESAADGRRLIGPLKRISTPVEQSIATQILSEHPEWNGKLLPTVLNAKAAFNVIGYIGLGFLLPLLTLALVNIARGILRLTRLPAG